MHHTRYDDLPAGKETVFIYIHIYIYIYFVRLLRVRISKLYFFFVYIFFQDIFIDCKLALRNIFRYKKMINLLISFIILF